MSDFELLSLIVAILGIVVKLLIEYIKEHKKSNRPRSKVAVTFL